MASYFLAAADLVFGRENCPVPLTMTLYDERGTRLVSWNDTFLFFDGPQPGTDYLNGFSEGSGPAGFRCGWLGSLASSRGRSSAVPLSVGREVRRMLPTGEAYWGRLVLGRAGMATLSTSGSSFDTILVVYDAEGFELYRNDDCDADTTSLIETNLEADSYYVRVTGYGTAEGEMKLLVQTP